MPYKRHKPVPEREMMQAPQEDEYMERLDPVSLGEMGRHRYDGHHSVCQVIREIYRMTGDEEIRMKCRIAMAMTKSMHKRLKQYKQAEEAKKDGNVIQQADGVHTEPR